MALVGGPLILEKRSPTRSLRFLPLTIVKNTSFTFLVIRFNYFCRDFVSEQIFSVWSHIKNNRQQRCGRLNPSEVCTKHRNYSKKGFQMFLDETAHVERQFYVTYRRWHRTHSGETSPWKFRIADCSHVLEIVDNSWVVPYFPVLSKVFQYCLKVELCMSRICGVKYPFEYMQSFG